ncbi:MAG: thiol reductant ABC exporter subunit CydC [Xanthobacteraceae bacterium]
MKHALHFIAMMWREESRWMLLGALASLAALFSAIALLGLSGWFITAAGLAGIAGIGLTFDFFSPSSGIRFLALFRTATRYGERLATHDATLRFLAKLRANLFSSIAKGGNASRRFRSSELLQRLTADLDAIDALYLRVVLPVAVAVVLAAVAAALLSMVSMPAVLVVLAAFVASVLAIYLGARVARKSARRLAIGSESLRIRTIDLMHAQTDLALAGGLETQQARIAKAGRYVANAGMSLARIEIAASAAIALIGAGLTLSLLVIGAKAIEAGTLDGPLMAMLVIGGFAALEVFAPLRRGAIEMGRIAFSGRRLAALARTEPAPDRRIFDPEGSAVELSGVTYRHGPHAAPVLENFSLSVRVGERVALTGKSGSGKSTLLSLIAGLAAPERGEIHIRDEGKRPALGLLTQQTELFRGTIAENLRIATPDATDAALWQALEVAELAGKIRGFPEGLAWQLGETGAGFSGGELRRLALARLVLRNPSIWLLDEPTAGMDEALAERVLANLGPHADGATMIVAAHHPREIALASRTISLPGTKNA